MDIWAEKCYGEKKKRHRREDCARGEKGKKMAMAPGVHEWMKEELEAYDQLDPAIRRELHQSGGFFYMDALLYMQKRYGVQETLDWVLGTVKRKRKEWLLKSYGLDHPQLRGEQL